jgi:Plavaka transposase
VGDPKFRSEDVRHTKWKGIDAKLAANDFDRSPAIDDDAQWMDENDGWQRTPISILVPFHHRTKKPGPQSFLVGDFYHRSIVSVIREKLANAHDVRHFHYEPFELIWQPSDSHSNVRVHGELYTSPAFLEAHRELQDSPREPGCNLPRVVVALMFWSDATQLTSFGTEQLWPGYLFFGNESKYRRCKPTSHLCHHVAYFQTVRFQ